MGRGWFRPERAKLPTSPRCGMLRAEVKGNAMKMVLAAALALSLGVNVWLGRAVADLENVRYGALIGMCMEEVRGEDYENPFTRLEYLDCLATQETRTNKAYHIAYALGLL